MGGAASLFNNPYFIRRLIDALFKAFIEQGGVHL